ncbi:serine protease [Lithospermum erythrorhizon]|uniref:Serine protease n=1 Tax=Lithospermum erythrorhizon TaxID=34254 RepID=A0AAV3QHB6_LITER
MYYSARGPDPEDTSLDDADILKPNLVAPGYFIWAAWSSGGADSVEFQGENFAMMSGTSMDAPHIAGLAALIKQKFQTYSPSEIASALSTTASLSDKFGGPIMAQPLDPGLIFDTSYDDYISFLCGINGSNSVVLNVAGNESYSVGWSAPYGIWSFNESGTKSLLSHLLIVFVVYVFEL